MAWQQGMAAAHSCYLSPCPPSPRCSDPEKLACCEQCLRLLAAQLWAPGAAGRSAAYATDAQQGLAVLLRALLTGCELVEASAADDSWQVGIWECSLCMPARVRTVAAGSLIWLMGTVFALL